LGDIRYSKLKERGIKCVVFDKDNTLTAPYQSEWYNARLQDCINDCKAEFGAVNVAICSNTAGSLRDKKKHNYADAEALQVILDLKVIRHDVNKPNTPISEIVSHFQSHRSMEIGETLPLRPDEIAIIGDRLVGDILWGNSLGMMSIKTQPLTPVGENWAVRWVCTKIWTSLRPSNIIEQRNHR
jgi:phosphatidylglycerophosphatase GEP4